MGGRGQIQHPLIPAKAGTHSAGRGRKGVGRAEVRSDGTVQWIPAFAAMSGI
jgi:hypothetical protein